MRITKNHGKTNLLKLLLLGALSLQWLSTSAHAWWDRDWTVRHKITLYATAAGLADDDVLMSAVVLIRLHEGNFDFAAARDDGRDIRFVAADGNTLLPYHIESYDNVLDEAYVWVKVPDIKGGTPVTFWLYYGNTGPNAMNVADSKATYEAETVLVYHFAKKDSPPKDYTGNANDAETAAIIVDGSLIAGGLRLTGKNSVTLPKSGSLAWTEGQALTWSAWIRPRALAPNAVIFSRHDGASGLVIGLDNGVPYVEVQGTNGSQRSGSGEPLSVNIQHHLAAVASGSEIKLFVDGEPYSSVVARLPALNTQALLGRDGTAEAPNADATLGFTGDLDELQISKVARPRAVLNLAAILEGGGAKAEKVLVVGPASRTQTITVYKPGDSGLTHDGISFDEIDKVLRAILDGAPPKMQLPRRVAITVDNSGNIKLNAEAVSLGDLETQLHAIRVRRPDAGVVVRGETATPFQAIMDVLDAIDRVGFTDIDLLVKPK